MVATIIAPELYNIQQRVMEGEQRAAYQGGGTAGGEAQPCNVTPTFFSPLDEGMWYRSVLG